MCMKEEIRTFTISLYNIFPQRRKKSINGVHKNLTFYNIHTTNESTENFQLHIA